MEELSKSYARTFSLVNRAIHGDGRAHESVLERLRPRLVTWCASRMSRKLRAKVDPEDVAQEVLVALHGALDTLEARSDRAFFAWVWRIAENRIRDIASYHGAWKRKTVEPRARTLTTPSVAVARKETAARLNDALAELPDDYREVIRLRRIEERSSQEVAQLLGRAEGATRMLYWRAMKALAKVLEARRTGAARSDADPARGTS